MRKTTITFLLFVGSSVNAQVSVPANSGSITNFVGWNSGQIFPLQIRHDADQPINFYTNGFQRMTITGGSSLISGFVGMGIASPVDRLHVHQPGSTTSAVRYTNNPSGVTASDGVQTGIRSNLDFRITQFEAAQTEIWTPGAATTPVHRFSVRANGQVLVGNGTMSENVINGGTITGFGGGTSLLNVRGPINSCAEFSSLAEQPTILYGYASPVDPAPGGDGFRMHMNLSFHGGAGRDALVFEKTDNNSPDPDGYIAFTNTGNDNTEEVSFYIDGGGRTCFGKDLNALANRVTIDSDPFADATPSGLRFVNLTSAATPVSNPGSGLLSVNAQGDVVYVTNPLSGSVFGNLCSAPDVPLTGDFELPMNDFNYHFTGNGGIANNNISVGYACGYVPSAKMDVMQTGYNTSIFSPVTATIAGNFHANRPASSVEVGVNGMATSSASTVTSTGGQFSSTGAAATNYGVYATASGGTNNWAGYFNGAVFLLSYTISDQNLKQDITGFTEANAVLSQLHPVSYKFRVNEFPQMNLEETTQIGLISQEVEQILPSLVREAVQPAVYGENGEMTSPAVSFKALSYEKLTPILVAGHQEQQSRIDSLVAVSAEKDAAIQTLNDRLTQLESCLQAMFPGMCETSQGMIQQHTPEMQQQLQAVNVYLSDQNTIILNQNTPNPFAESTVITYSVPATVKKAQIHFYDASGKLLQSVEIAGRGAGKLQIFGQDLSSGTYTYTLVADGQVSASRKLVKQ